MTNREVMQQALEALESGLAFDTHSDVLQNLRAAMEQQAEPVARKGFEKWAKSLPNYIDLSRFEDGYSDCNTDYAWAGWQAAKRPWVGLTDEEITELRLKTFDSVATNYESYRAIEAKLKEKNDY